MRAYQLFCLCSFVASALAIEFAAYGTANGDTALTSDLSAPIAFNFAVDGVSMQSVRISAYGAVFPNQFAVGDASNTAPSTPDVPFQYKQNSYPVLGPLWAKQTISGGLGSVFYRITTDATFLNHWAQKVTINPQNFQPVKALVVSWVGMQDPSNPNVNKKNNYQIVLLVDDETPIHAAWIFYNYNGLQWTEAPTTAMRVGYAAGPQASSEYYESAVSDTAQVTSQSNVFFKLSQDPSVDNNQGNPKGKLVLSNEYPGQAITPDHTSHGPTAFNFFKKGATANTAYAISGSKLYCFLHAYTGAANNLHSATNIYAISNQANTQNVWQFSAHHVFRQGTTYYCYSDTAASVNLAMMAASSRSAGSSYFLAESASGSAFVTNTGKTFAYTFTSILYGDVAADPVFSSLRTGDKFIFHGEAGKTFNIYSDKWSNVNAEFAYAHASTQEGTVMETVGVMVGGHKISFSAKDFSHSSITVNLDGKDVKLVDELVHLSGCVDVHFLESVRRFYIVTPSHSFKFWVNERHNDHIDRKFINLHIEEVPHGHEEKQFIGGVLGQTVRSGPISLVNEEFEASNIFGIESSANFKAEILEC